MQTRLFPLLAFIALTACHEGDPTDLNAARALYTGTDSMGMSVSGRTIPIHARPALLENSGLAVSISQPAVIFAINDGGNEPLLFALDTSGGDRGTWRLQGATNADWEAIAPGPCDGSGTESAKMRRSCLYIADVGDNEAVRRSVTLYRVHEPMADTAGALTTISAESLSFTYEDGPHDVEAMFVTRDGAVNLITKRPLRAIRWQRRPALIFAIPASAWRQPTAIAHAVDSLRIVPGSAPNRVITDASLSRDGKYLAVRTYWQVYVFVTDSASGRVVDFNPRAVCNVAGLREAQGEGIAWYLDSRQLMLSSEGPNQPLRIISCPGS